MLGAEPVLAHGPTAGLEPELRRRRDGGSRFDGRRVNERTVLTGGEERERGNALAAGRGTRLSDGGKKLRRRLPRQIVGRNGGRGNGRSQRREIDVLGHARRLERNKRDRVIPERHVPDGRQEELVGRGAGRVQAAEALYRSGMFDRSRATFPLGSPTFLSRRSHVTRVFHYHLQRLDQPAYLVGQTRFL